jgi:hypothetical protein
VKSPGDGTLYETSKANSFTACWTSPAPTATCSNAVYPDGRRAGGLDLALQIAQRTGTRR